MSDVISGRITLEPFKGLAACGGFSYGDVLGAGEGWAKSILFNARARETFAAFFERTDTFGLGVCNGCQMIAQLKALIPGAEHWPRFLHNRSEQFEARLSLVEVLESPSLFLHGMAGSRIPIAVSHGEGRAQFDAPEHVALAKVALRFVDPQQVVEEQFVAIAWREPFVREARPADQDRAERSDFAVHAGRLRTGVGERPGITPRA